MTKSQIFLYFCLSFILGIFFSSLIKIPLVILGGFFILGVVLAVIFWLGKRKFVVVGFCLMLFALGAWRYLRKEQVGDLNQLNDRGRLTIIGMINDLPDRRSASQKLVIKTQELIIGGQSVKIEGLAMVTTKLYPEYNYGDVTEIVGQLKEPENFLSTQLDQSAVAGIGASDDFDYKSYLAKSDIYSVMSFPEIKVLDTGQGSRIKSGLFWLKKNFESVLAKTLPEPQSSFMAGLTLGEKKTMPEDLTEAFKITGTTHIIALSGYNIGLIASFIMGIFTLLLVRRTLRFWLAVLAIIFFTILTGASASIFRAAIMGVLVLLARQEGRMYNIRNALIFAGAVMVYLNPKILRFDIGFQLSFMATAGLIWLAPIFDKWLKNLPNPLKLKEILIATLAAQLAVLPLLLIYFGQLAIISPIVNLIILLFVPQTMLLGFATGILGLLWLLPAKLFAWIAWLYLTFELWVIKFFASLPLASIKMHWGWGLAVFYYLILTGLLYLFHQKQIKQILVEQYDV